MPPKRTAIGKSWTTALGCDFNGSSQHFNNCVKDGAKYSRYLKHYQRLLWSDFKSLSFGGIARQPEVTMILIPDISSEAVVAQKHPLVMFWQ